MLVVLVIGGERLLYVVVPQQYRAGTGVFAKDHIGIAQYFYSAIGDITEVADGRRYQVEGHDLLSRKSIVESIKFASAFPDFSFQLG